MENNNNPWWNRLQRFRESTNLKLYASKFNALRILRVSSGIVATLTLLALVYFHGFKINQEENRWIIFIVKASIAFYIFKYIIEFVYSFSPMEHLKETKWEGFLMVFLVINIISIQITGIDLVGKTGDFFGFTRLSEILVLIIQGYFLLIVFLEIGKASTFLPLAKLSPPTILILSFLILILFGTLLLLLPEMNVTGESMRFQDALFTSISASCVTGLTVVDTATYLSFKGQFIVMTLIQLGGLNIISFATLFAFFSRKGLGIRHQSMIQEGYLGETLNTSSELLKQIFRFTLVIELLGALLLFFTLGDRLHFNDLQSRIFFSVFHSISAFNNAGFSTLSNGLFEETIRNAYLLQFTIACLVILGGLGFGTIRDVFTIKFVRERIQKPWLHTKIGTKISIYSAAALLTLGTVVFFSLENDGVISHLTFGEKLMTSFFQSVTTRTAGFNTVDIGALSLPVLIFFIFLMFIGASTGSTGGGIKTSTFTLVLLSAYSTIRGKKNLELFKKRIPWELLNKAFSIFLFSGSFILTSLFFLTITDPDIPLKNLMFEEVSAFCTVGLSTGITGDLSLSGKFIIMTSMFIGRIGTLTLAIALGRRLKSNNYKYPKADLMVG